MMIQPLMIGTTELIVIGGAVLLLFGGKKIPELMRSLGQGKISRKACTKKVSRKMNRCWKKRKLQTS